MSTGDRARGAAWCHAHGRRRFLAGALGCAALTLSGCAPRREDPDARAPLPKRPTWPSPPAPPRVVYETTLRSSADVMPESDADRMRALLGGGVTPVARFQKPYAVAAARGVVYVTDTVLRIVLAFDVPRKRYFEFGFRFEGKLAKPLGIAVDARSRVYVADVSARSVVAYDALGLYAARFGDGDGLVHPADVAVDAAGDRVYVVDMGGVESNEHRVVAYGADGRRRFAIGTRGGEPGRFNLPVSAAVAPDGTLYVLDAGNFRVQAFDRDGRFLRAWGGVGRGFGQFARPKSIAVDGDGLVYVADAAFGNVQIFRPDGVLLLPVGAAGRVDEPGRYALLTGVAADEAGFLYLLDQAFAKLDVLRRLGDDESRRLTRARSAAGTVTTAALD